MKLLVLGANGLIGGEVCRAAVAAGAEVVGVSRSGPPKGSDSWAERMTWIQADALEPAHWRAHLAGCEAVVHSIGILRERPAEGATFSRINGDTAILAADEAERAGVPTFAFISAALVPPGVSRAYLEHKRRAERYLLTRSLRPLVLRPSLVYGARRPLSMGLGRAWEAAQRLPLAPRAVPASLRPLPVERLARAVLEGVRRPVVRGVLGVADIERLSQAWGV